MPHAFVGPDGKLRRRLVFMLPVDLDKQMRRIAYELDDHPGKSTIGAWIEHAVREQVARDAQELARRHDVGERFGVRKASAPTGPKVCENGSPLLPGKCDPARAAECARDAANMIDPSEGGHIFGAEGPYSIGPSWCARCGARQEPTERFSPAHALVFKALPPMPGQPVDTSVLISGATRLDGSLDPRGAVLVTALEDGSTPHDADIEAEIDDAAQMADLEDSDEPIV